MYARDILQFQAKCMFIHQIKSSEILDMYFKTQNCKLLQDVILFLNCFLCPIYYILPWVCLSI